MAGVTLTRDAGERRPASPLTMLATRPPTASDARRIVVTRRERAASPLHRAVGVEIPDPSIEAILGALAADGVSSPWVIAGGGEPTLRADLPELLEALAGAGPAKVGLETDGLALTDRETVASLRDAGLAGVRIGFHCGRIDAHDWLTGVGGSARRARRAIQACRDAGLRTEATVMLTRPTAPHFPETVAVLARLGIARVHVRIPAPARLAPEDVVAVTPRLAVLGAHLDSASRVARGEGVELLWHELPACGLGGQAQDFPSVFEPVRDPGAGGGARANVAAAPADRCPECPGPGGCPGAPLGYTASLGWMDLDAAGSRRPTAWADEVPAARSLRIAFGGPSRVACRACGDAGPTEPEPTRGIRIRLARSPREGATTLRIASAASLAHPQAADLLRETTRLSFPRVEVAGEGSALAEWSDGEVARLQGLTRVDVALYGPTAGDHDRHAGREGAFAAALRGLERLRDLAGVETGAFGVLHDHRALEGFAGAWARGHLPGAPAFRLSPQGGSLDALAEEARKLPSGPARRAIAAVLPACLGDGALDMPAAAAPAERAWGDGRTAEVPASGSDRFGAYLPCPQATACGAAGRCPGLAVGWSARDLRPQAAGAPA